MPQIKPRLLSYPPRQKKRKNALHRPLHERTNLDPKHAHSLHLPPHTAGPPFFLILVARRHQISVIQRHEVQASVRQQTTRVGPGRRGAHDGDSRLCPQPANLWGVGGQNVLDWVSITRDSQALPFS